MRAADINRLAIRVQKLALGEIARQDIARHLTRSGVQ